MNLYKVMYMNKGLRKFLNVLAKDSEHAETRVFNYLKAIDRNIAYDMKIVGVDLIAKDVIS